MRERNRCHVMLALAIFGTLACASFSNMAAAALPDDMAHARRILNEGVASGNPNTRKEATVSIGLVGQHEHSARQLLTLLHDRDVQVRLAAIASLTDLRDRAAIPALQDALKDPVPEVAFAAAKALWSMKQAAGRDYLLAVLAGDTRAKSNPIRSEFRDLMRTVSVPRTAFVFALKEGVGMVPLPGVGTGFAAMESLFWDTGLSPRASVPLLLAQDRDGATHAALIQALSDGDWAVRAATAQAIALRNRPALARYLLPLLDDGNEKVRFRAAAGYLRLAQIGHTYPAAKPDATKAP